METLVFFDIETTGLNPRVDRLIEIYMLKVAEDGEAEEFGTLLQPGFPLPAKISEITGLCDEDLRMAPSEGEAAACIRRFIGDGILVAHNLPFDKGFLEQMCLRQGLPRLPVGGIDTLKWSRELLPRLCVYPGSSGSHQLGNLMQHFCLDARSEQLHRARDDVRILVQLYRALRDYEVGKS